MKITVIALQADAKVTSTEELMLVFQRFSSWIRLKKFVALFFRWQRQFHNKRSVAAHIKLLSVKSGLVSVGEMEEAEREIIKCAQSVAYKEEIDALKSGSSLKKTSPLIKPDPVLIDGFMCVGGRLLRALIPSSQKHQLIVPKRSHIANLTVEHFHLTSGHSGREYVHGLVRENFWLVNAHSTVRTILHDCFDCRRRLAPVLEQKMADLPLNRIVKSKILLMCHRMH